MKSIIVEGKTLEEAYEKAEKELKATKDQITFNVLEEKKTLLKKNYTLEATLNVDYPLKGLEYLKTILEQLNVNAMVEMRKKANKDVQYVITSEENPILIGRGGKTLEAIQMLVRIIVNGDIEEAEEQYHVSVDCGGYKKQRIRQLEVLATKTAKEVAESKVEVHLEPMNSYERRIIHTKLSEWRDVYTESEGEGKARHIVIKPKGDK
ncbi:MAG: Jag N-terminal domain-containing protein [Bacillales bacterium]|nr:Jag N-terminal domain-containing protein [Bacillales bacterium]